MEYKFCEQIDRYICFNQDYIATCTIGNNFKGKMLPFIKTGYKGEPIDWYKYLWDRQEIKKECAKGNLPEVCEGCQSLQVKNWDEINTRWEFQYIQLSHWLNCNSNCIYCENHTNLPDPHAIDTYDSLPIVKDLIARGYVTENTEFDFAGGEPTMYYHFEDIMNIILNIDVKKIIIHTNAIKFSKTIYDGIKSGQVSVCVSLDAGSKSVHEKVKQVKTYDKVWANIKKYASCKQPLNDNFINLKYIIVPGLNDTKEEIELWMKKSLKYANMLILSADDRIFRKYPNPEDRKEINEKIYELSEFFVKKSKEMHIYHRIEYNIRTVYMNLNKKVPENKK